MNFLPDDLWMRILARLPLKCITTSKLVCKQWKSLVESEYLRSFILSQQQNSSSSFSSWSLMWRKRHTEFMAQYGHDIPQSLGSYISSFLAEMSKTQKKKHKLLPKRKRIKTVKVVAYTNVGLILICVKSVSGDRTYYVSNPLSKQIVQIPPLSSPASPWFRREKRYKPAGLATRIKNGIVSDYKVVCHNKRNIKNGVLSFMIYSSETNLWSFKKVHSTIPLFSFNHHSPVSLNGKIYWTVARNEYSKNDLVGYDFYSDSNQCSIIPFPELKSEQVELFKRACTISQGFLMYMNIISEKLEDLEELPEEDSSDGELDFLCVWKLKHCTADSRDWKLVGRVLIPYYRDAFDNTCYIPLTIHPFDAKIAYLLSREDNSLIYINLENDKFVTNEGEEELEPRSDGVTMKSISFYCHMFPELPDEISESYFSIFILTPWLQQIP